MRIRGLGAAASAEYQERNPDADLDAPPDRIRITRKGSTYRVVVPDLELDVQEAIRTGKKPVIGLGASVVSCVERPHRVGGWDSLARRALPVLSVLPPRSTLFCDIRRWSAPNELSTPVTDGVRRSYDRHVPFQ